MNYFKEVSFLLGIFVLLDVGVLIIERDVVEGFLVFYGGLII